MKVVLTVLANFFLMIGKSKKGIPESADGLPPRVCRCYRNRNGRRIHMAIARGFLDGGEVVYDF